MQTEQLNLSKNYAHRKAGGKRSKLSKSSAAWIVSFAVFGFFAILGLRWIVLKLPRHGDLAAVAIILFVPISLACTALAVPQLVQRMEVLKPKLRWWHALWLLLYISTLVFRIRDQEATQAQPLDAWTLMRIIPEMIVGLWLMGRLYRRREAVAWVRYMFHGLPGLLTMFGLVCVASTAWSVYAAWTLYKSLEYCLDISVLAVALANIHSLDEYEDLFNWTWTIFGVELLWVWLQIPLWPGESILDGRLKGIIPATSENAVGQSGAIFVVLALCRLLPLNRRRTNTPFWSVLFAFGMASLLFSQTRNAIAGLALAVVFMLALSKRTWMAMLAAVVGALAWFLTPVGDMTMEYLQRDQSAAAMKSLTGRATFWSFAWEQFLQHPWTGMGAYAAGRFYIMTKLGSSLASLHSDWIEVLVGVGLLGLIPFLIVVLGTWRYLIQGVNDRSLDPHGRQMAYEAVGVMSVITIHSIFNVELIWHVPLLLLVLLGYAEMLRRRKLVPARVAPFLARTPVGARA
jgi:O-antigen ligase